MDCEEIVNNLIDQLKGSKDEPIRLSEEMVDYLVEADSKEKKPFTVLKSRTVEYPFKGHSKITNDEEKQYPEPGFFLGEIPGRTKESSAIGFGQDTKGTPGYQLYLLPNRRIALFKKEDGQLSVSPGIAQGESDTYTTLLNLVKTIEF